MKKGALTAAVLFVLVVGILGAVLLYSGGSSPTGAVQVTGKDTSGSFEFSSEKNDGDCECHVWCDPSGNTGPNTHGFPGGGSVYCACKTAVANSCDTPCQNVLDEVSANNPEFTCALRKKSSEKSSKCTKDPRCGTDKFVEICHCYDANGLKCHTLIIESADRGHIGANAHPPGKDTEGPCPTGTSTTTTTIIVPSTTTTEPPSSTTTVTVPSTTSTTVPPVTTTTSPVSTTSTT